MYRSAVSGVGGGGGLGRLTGHQFCSAGRMRMIHETRGVGVITLLLALEVHSGMLSVSQL